MTKEEFFGLVSATIKELSRDLRKIDSDLATIEEKQKILPYPTYERDKREAEARHNVLRGRIVALKTMIEAPAYFAIKNLSDEELSQYKDQLIQEVDNEQKSIIEERDKKVAERDELKNQDDAQRDAYADTDDKDEQERIILARTELDKKITRLNDEIKRLNQKISDLDLKREKISARPLESVREDLLSKIESRKTIEKSMDLSQEIDEVSEIIFELGENEKTHTAAQLLNEYIKLAEERENAAANYGDNVYAYPFYSRGNPDETEYFINRPLARILIDHSFKVEDTHFHTESNNSKVRIYIKDVAGCKEDISKYEEQLLQFEHDFENKYSKEDLENLFTKLEKGIGSDKETKEQYFLLLDQYKEKVADLDKDIQELKNLLAEKEALESKRFALGKDKKIAELNEKIDAKRLSINDKIIEVNRKEYNKVCETAKKVYGLSFTRFPKNSAEIDKICTYNQGQFNSAINDITQAQTRLDECQKQIDSQRKALDIDLDRIIEEMRPMLKPEFQQKSTAEIREFFAKRIQYRGHSQTARMDVKGLYDTAQDVEIDKATKKIEANVGSVTLGDILQAVDGDKKQKEEEK
ncbi:MAG: hypothetical protein IKR04_04330 [Clostridia bacterium]|nr:hypothetical protein [Clostridia bacterium]